MVQEVFEVAGLDAAEVLVAADRVHQERVRAECTELALAPHWADLHAPESEPLSALPIVDRDDLRGGVGVPTVLAGAAAELGAVWKMSPAAVESLMADAPDVRHRLPGLWAVVHAGQVSVWKARRVAAATHDLSRAAAARVGEAVLPDIERVSWRRFEQVLRARIAEADPERAAAKAAAAAAARYVRSYRDEHGLIQIVVRATAGDGAVFMALVDRIAQVLHGEGDADPADVRRSKAIGILARPGDAVELMCGHRDDPDVPPVPGPLDPQVDHVHPDEHDGWAERSLSADEPEDAEPEPLEEKGRPRFRPPVVDPRRLRPVVQLYAHLSADAIAAGRGAARLEGYGMVTITQLVDQLTALGCAVKLQPVLDLNDTPPPVDRYEIPHRMREHLRLRQPGSVFPWSTYAGRGGDLDHATPWRPPDRGGPPGQTAVEKLGPLTRREHLIKTFRHWRRRQPEPDVYVWRSRHGWVYLVDADGTHNLGHGVIADAVWHAADTSGELEDRSRIDLAHSRLVLGSAA